MSTMFPTRWIDGPADPAERDAGELLASARLSMAPAVRRRVWRKIETAIARPSRSAVPALAWALAAALGISAVALVWTGRSVRPPRDARAPERAPLVSTPGEESDAPLGPPTAAPAPERPAVGERFVRPRPPASSGPAAMTAPAAGACEAAPDSESCLAETARGSDLSAQNALYRLGSLRLARGAQGAAFETWEESRRRFPDGILRHEIDLAILDARIRSTDVALASHEADDFLRRYPTSERVPEVRVVRANLALRTGDASRALDDYRRALAWLPGGDLSTARRDEALHGVAAALDRLGRRDEARAAYRAYLEALPAGRFAADARAALERN